MTYVQDPWDFIEVNESDLRGIIVSIAGHGCTEDHIHDHIVEFGMRCARYNLLGKYDRTLSSLSTYVYRIIQSEMITQATRHRRHAYRVRYTPLIEEYSYPEDPSRDRVIDAMRFGNHLLKTRRRLFPVYKRLLAGLYYREIAAELRIPRGSMGRIIAEIRLEYQLWSQGGETGPGG